MWISHSVSEGTTADAAFAGPQGWSTPAASHTQQAGELPLLPPELRRGQSPPAELANETITFAPCAATLRLPHTPQMDLFGPVLNINIARLCVKCVCNAFYETLNKFCAEEYVFPYGLLKERQM